ncbi:MAG: DUF3298 domain-containing protein [Anaerolineae bacterium]
MRTRALLTVIVMLLMGAITVAAQTTTEDLCYQKGGNWNADTLKCTAEAGVKVSVEYPLELAPFTTADQIVSQWLGQQQQDFISSYTFVPEVPSYANSWDMNISYQWFSHGSDTISLLFSNSFYTGGAHPNMDYHSFTFNQADQHQMTLAEVFRDSQIPWDSVWNFVRDDLRAKLGGEAADMTWIEQGSGTNPDNYQNWVITETSLIFYFPPYQVTAYAGGPQQVEIPFTALHMLLAPQFEA